MSDKAPSMLFEDLDKPQMPPGARELLARIQKSLKETQDLCAQFEKQFASLTPGNPTTGRIMYFDCKHRDKFNVPAVISHGKDQAIVKRLIERYGVEDVDRFIDQFFASDDEFITRAGYTIGILQSFIPRLISQSNAPVRLHGVTANTRMNGTHARAAADLIRRQHGR